jgi:arsenite methyltransferase
MARLRHEVRRAFSAIAEHPQHEPPFPTGRGLAEDLGYPADMLDSLPAESVEAFCGVSNVSLFAEIPTGATVLDLGAGAGLDTLIASKRTGPKGKVIGIDFSKAMLARASRAVSEFKATNVGLRIAGAEELPVENASVDVAIVNGIFNLNPNRAGIFRELSRVVRPGGAVFAAELVLIAPLTLEESASSTNWFS